MNVMRAKYDPTRIEYLDHAEELAQSIDLGAVQSDAKSSLRTSCKAKGKTHLL